MKNKIADLFFSRSERKAPEVLIDELNPKSSLVEAYRNLRTNLKFMSPDRELKKLVITSAESGAGKSYTACNLAISMAQNGERVILIDADLHKPKQHKLLQITGGYDGLSDVLSGEISLEEALRNTSVENLQFVPVGFLPPNPAEMIESNKMDELLLEAEKFADRIILDTPPAGAITDAAILGNRADGTLLVVKSHDTTRKMVINTLEKLENASANVLGTVLNLHPIQSKDYYYSSYYYSDDLV